MTGDPAAPSRRRSGRARKVLALSVVTLALFLLVDGLRPPARQTGVAVGLFAIDVYQATASRGFGRIGARCRFEPSCSHYGELALRNRGLLPGGWLILRRIARCGPWTPSGTIDLPPPPRTVSGAGSGG